MWFLRWRDAYVGDLADEVAVLTRHLRVSEGQYDRLRERLATAGRGLDEAAGRAASELVVREALEVSLRVAREDLRAWQRRYAGHMNMCPVLETVNDHDMDKARENAT